MSQISLIIPLRLTAQLYEATKRLTRLIQNIPRDLFEIIISDYGTDREYTAFFTELRDQGLRVIHHPTPEKIFSIGMSRDFGVQMAQSNVIMFNDLDFLGTPDMYRRIYAVAQQRNLAQNPLDFFCVPVMFLTENGTNTWFKHPSAFIQDFRPQSLDLLQQFIKYPAFGSSAMVINRLHYLSLGGHNPKFSGHGAEDFDLLHRLCALSPRAPRPHDYYTDYRDNRAYHYWGFRSFFALYGLDLFYQEIYLVHLWHPRRQERKYVLQKEKNFRQLKKLMQEFDLHGTQPSPLCDLNTRESVLVIVHRVEDILYLRTILAGAFQYVIQLRAKKLKFKNNYSTIILIRYKNDPPDTFLSISQAKIIYLEIDLDHICSVKYSTANSFSVKIIQYTVLYTIKHKPIFAFTDNLEINGFPDYPGGVIPQSVSGESKIFASFGGSTAFDQYLHPRPEKQPQHSRIFRIWKRIISKYGKKFFKINS